MRQLRPKAVSSPAMSGIDSGEPVLVSSAMRLAGSDRGTLFRASLITPAQPSSRCPRHRTELWDTEIRSVDGRHNLGVDCAAFDVLIDVVLGEDPRSANLVANELARSQLVG
jgi:hypothetical protein